MRTEFIHALESVAADKAIRALVLTGAGKGFCAGGDIAGHGAADAGADRRDRASTAGTASNAFITPRRCCTRCPSRRSPPSTVRPRASVPTPRWRATSSSPANGPTSAGRTSTAGSFRMAAACTSCRGASGLPKAKELIFTGRKVDADEALALGIVDRKTAPTRWSPTRRPGPPSSAKGSATALALCKTILEPELRDRRRSRSSRRAARRRASATRAPSTANR